MNLITATGQTAIFGQALSALSDGRRPDGNRTAAPRPKGPGRAPEEQPQPRGPGPEREPEQRHRRSSSGGKPGRRPGLRHSKPAGRHQRRSRPGQRNRRNDDDACGRTSHSNDDGACDRHRPARSNRHRHNRSRRNQHGSRRSRDRTSRPWPSSHRPPGRFQPPRKRSRCRTTKSDSSEFLQTSTENFRVPKRSFAASSQCIHPPRTRQPQERGVILFGQ